MNILVRRAVIVDGAVREKKHHPGSLEIETVSRLLENERDRQGVASVPRFTTQLMERALSTNDPKCWEAAVDDIDTEDFDSPAVASLFAQDDTLPVMLVTCIVTCKTKEDLLNMLQIFYHVSKDFTVETRDIVAKAITCQWKSFVNVLITVVNTAPRMTRDAYFLEMGKFLKTTDMNADSIVCALNEVIKQKKYDILNTFMHMDCKTCLSNDTHIFVALMRAAKHATITSKHCVVAFVAKIAQELPELADAHQKEIEDMVTDTLFTTVNHGYSDKRMILALGFLTEKYAAKDDLARNIARLLQWTVQRL